MRFERETTIIKEKVISIGHQLPEEFVKENHPCSQPHGHNLKVRISLKLKDPSIFIDLGEIGKIIQEYDHKFFKGTMEELALKIGNEIMNRYSKLLQEFQVSIKETEENQVIVSFYGKEKS
jgi:6-pyruvoyl-tetrahydropterin synthase